MASILRVDQIQTASGADMLSSNGSTLTIAQPLNLTGRLDLPTWTTGTRPSAASGTVGLNTDTGTVEVYNGSQWNEVGAGGAFQRLSSPGYYYTSFSSSPSGTLTASSTFGVPSSAKALLVSGYYHITGYSSGWNDHVTCIFGGYPSASTGSNWSFTGSTSAIWQEFVLYHDGDSSGSPHHYGYWTDGGVISTNNDTIYYQLGKGRSGGTHYVHIWCFGYWE